MIARLCVAVLTSALAARAATSRDIATDLAVNGRFEEMAGRKPVFPGMREQEKRWDLAGSFWEGGEEGGGGGSSLSRPRPTFFGRLDSSMHRAK